MTSHKNEHYIENLRQIVYDKLKAYINNDGIVLVKLKGKCKNCPVTNISIKTIIENSLIKEVSDVKYVLGI